jgi:hypothetical protein
LQTDGRIPGRRNPAPINSDVLDTGSDKEWWSEADVKKHMDLMQAPSRSRLTALLECGLDRSYIGSVERGERNISLENICRIAAAVGVEPKELFERWTPRK